MKIEALQSHNYKRHRNPKGCYFQNLPAWARDRARRWLDFFLARHRASGLPLESWRLPLLVGQARRLAQNPPDSRWGRSMRARKAGRAAQRKYLAEGRKPLIAFNHSRQIMESAQGPEKAVGRSKPPAQVTFSLTPISIHGKVRGSKPPDLAKQIADQVTYKLSSDERFGLNVWPQPSLWEFHIVISPVS